MSFKVLNSIILLGHSYKVIQKYHSKNQPEQSFNQDIAESKQTNENSFSSNVVPPALSSCFGRRSSFDSQVSRNFSQVLSADSLSEITQISCNTPIEQSDGFKITEKRSVTSELDKDIQGTESESEIWQKNTPSEVISLLEPVHDSSEKISRPPTNYISSNEPVLELNNQSNDPMKSVKVLPHCQEVTVFQRSSRSVLMSFNVGKTLSASVPENIGNLEYSDNENSQSRDVERLKLE